MINKTKKLKRSVQNKIAKNQQTLLGFDADGYPILAAYRIPERAAHLIFVDCPFCGRRHCHGAPPGGEAGHRVPHCFPDELAPPGGYILCEVEQETGGQGRR